MLTNIVLSRVNRLLSVAATGVLLTVASASAQDLHTNLISVDALKQALGDENLLVLDASPTRLYLEAHIPGAHSVSFTEEESVSQGVNLSYGGGVDYFTDQVDALVPFQEAAPDIVQDLFQQWGVGADKKVVVYDQGGSFFASRLFYSLYYHGFPVEQLQILDGGLSKWQAEGFEVTREIPDAPARGSFEIGELRAESKVGVEEFLTASGDRENNILIEALGPDWHFGAALNYNRRGHIPFAKMVPTPEFFNEDKTFKSPEQIRALAELVGVRPEQAIYTHCGGGIAGSLAFFALKFLGGYEDVKHFPESQLGWLRDARELPYWTYDAPYILRESEWVQWWAGQRTRTLGSIHVSVVDIRPEDEYGRRHLPFALNIPATAFAESTDAELAAKLGSSGVNPKHEAVIVSANGIDKDAALAYVRLEALGQKDISIFTDTVEAWVAKGFPVRDTPTLVAEKASRHDLAIPPVAYEAAARDGVIAGALTAPSGNFPRVILASGETLPASLDDGDAKVVHVPYTKLLDNGVPRPANEIWDILSEAGVPRFAEIVTVADDAGEAAIGYVILKLMGYPGISTALANAESSGT